MHHRNHEQALPGDNVGICVKGLKPENMPKAGDIMYITSEPDSPGIVEEFTVTAFCQDHPGQLKCTDKNGKGEIIPEIRELNQEVLDHCFPNQSVGGRGGMESKARAAGLAMIF